MSARSRLALVALGPLVWFAHLSVLYALVPPACQAGTSLALHAATATALLALAGGAVWVRRRGMAGTLATVVFTSLAYFALVVAMTGVVPLVVRRCA